jgi:hypothetical protein
MGMIRTSLWIAVSYAISLGQILSVKAYLPHHIHARRLTACWGGSALCSSPIDSQPGELDAVSVDPANGPGNSDSDSNNSQLTDWVIEGLESEGNRITSSSSVKAGENDIIPGSGLCIGKVRILPAGYNDNNDNDNDSINDDLQPIRLLVGRNGWGTGVHPTTRLCLEWVCDTLTGGEVLLDYGCGSGILSIAALHMGAARCVGVDVEAEALVASERNVHLNGYSEAAFTGLHTREVVPYALCTPVGVDVCVANILIGQLCRASMVAAIVSNMVPGALLCLSGIRPDEVDSLKAAYSDHMEWLDDQYAELSASETVGSVESYGFDCGRWARLVGRKTEGAGRDRDIESMSELAVS